MPASSVPVLLVDGHNVIFAWQDLRQTHQRSPAQARQEFCRLLTTYQDVSGTRVVVVFDSGPSSSNPEPEPEAPGVQVLYAQAQGSADTVLARLASRYAGQYAITVASDDVAVQHSVAAADGCWISTAALRCQVENAIGDFRRKWTR
jgi:predicted RNA-binding protein with PIN domain